MGWVDTEEAHILGPHRAPRYSMRSLWLRVGLGEYCGLGEGGLVPESLMDRCNFVGVMAVAITRRVGTHDSWEFPGVVDEGFLRWVQQPDRSWVLVGLLVEAVEDAAFRPWLMAFFDDL